MALGPTYQQAFYINESGVILPNGEAVSLNMGTVKQSTPVETDAANWDGANNAALAANSANGTNNNLPAALTQAGWLILKNSAGNNMYVPYWL